MGKSGNVTRWAPQPEISSCRRAARFPSYLFSAHAHNDLPVRAREEIWCARPWQSRSLSRDRSVEECNTRLTHTQTVPAPCFSTYARYRTDLTYVPATDASPWHCTKCILLPLVDWPTTCLQGRARALFQNDTSIPSPTRLKPTMTTTKTTRCPTRSRTHNPAFPSLILYPASHPFGRRVGWTRANRPTVLITNTTL